MKFKEHHYYKHKAFRDVCIKVVKVSFACEDYAKMKVEYVVIGSSGEPRKLVDKKNYVVTSEDFENWEMVSDEDVTQK